MIAPNYNFLCKQAEPYYYDLLLDESRKHIPESIVNHAKQCQNCLEKINKLREALLQANAPESEQRQACAAVTTMLKLHFDYIGKPVTCNIAKPFLPCLFVPLLGIKIPTPIMTHLENCQRCSEDLDTIRRLRLNDKQLCRLSRLFAEERGDYKFPCTEAYDAILAVASMDFRETTEEVLKHLCTCSYCRKLLYKYRGAAREECMREKSYQEFPCDEVSASDIFDYVVPYGIDPANDQYEKFRESFTSHAANCPNCLAKMQQLHETIYNIYERAESDVVTVYYVDESARAEARSESDDVYAGFPVRAEITSRKDVIGAKPIDSTISFATVLKKHFASRNIKSLAKIASVAVALLIGIAIFIKAPTAKAVTIDQIYKAIEKVKNVHISTFVPDGTKESIQERWVSRALNVYMMKTGKLLILSDVPNGVRKIKQLDTGIIETQPLTQDIGLDIEKQMAGSLGLTPFTDISDVPSGSEWSRVTNRGIESVSKDTDVYDLNWREKAYDSSVMLKKWRVFANTKTNLPQRVEWHKKLASDDGFVLETITLVEYLSDTEILNVIKDAGF